MLKSFLDDFDVVGLLCPINVTHQPNVSIYQVFNQSTTYWGKLINRNQRKAQCLDALRVAHTEIFHNKQKEHSVLKKLWQLASVKNT
jgi:hypothetical protein